MDDRRENASQPHDEARAEVAEELPAFGYSWECSACGAVVKGYAVLCACGDC